MRHSPSELLGLSNGSFAAEQRFSVGTAPGSLAVADFNNDGVPDIVVANVYSNSVTVLLGIRDSTFAGGASAWSALQSR